LPFPTFGWGRHDIGDYGFESKGVPLSGVFEVNRREPFGLVTHAIDGTAALSNAAPAACRMTFSKGVLEFTSWKPVAACWMSSAVF
jgi:hypothetical protein